VKLKQSIVRVDVLLEVQWFAGRDMGVGVASRASRDSRENGVWRHRKGEAMVAEQPQLNFINEQVTKAVVLKSVPLLQRCARPGAGATNFHV
jgi:hypothetical protein